MYTVPGFYWDFASMGRFWSGSEAILAIMDLGN